MRLELLNPPALVCVDRCPALLLARRGDRRYVQVNRGAGLNHLRWVAAGEVGPTAAVPVPGRAEVEPAATPARGLPRALR